MNWRFLMSCLLFGAACSLVGIGCIDAFRAEPPATSAEKVVCEIELGSLDTESDIVLRVEEQTIILVTNLRTGNKGLLTLRKGTVVRAAELKEVNPLPEGALHAALLETEEKE